MSSNSNHINLGNYEEYFILYMDNELLAEEKLMVEEFVAKHPHLSEELEILMSTKLPVDELSFSGKEELLSATMKVNVVDESLLLYIDNELTPAGKAAVEEKINTDKDYALQHSVLRQTKLDASEKILHPNKRELYRHSERVISLKVWMRVAAAVIVLLLGSLYFFSNKNEVIVPGNELVNNGGTRNPEQTKKEIKPAPQQLKQPFPAEEQPALVNVPQKKEERKPPLKDIVVDDNDNEVKNEPMEDNESMVYDSPLKREAIKFDVRRFTEEPQIKNPTVNNTVAYHPVTSSLNDRIIDEDVEEPAVTDGDFKDKKKTPAKGFFRKVSRFIERNTGIGTVNADNELLIGAVALKLK